MPEAGESGLFNVLGRVGLWFVSLLLAVALFSLAFSLRESGLDGFTVVLRITMIFAFPVGCLFLPFIISAKTVEGNRFWLILSVGSLVGPVAIFAWCVLLQLGGGNPHEIWFGDPLIGISAFAEMAFALIVGFMTTCFYLNALKIIRRSAGRAAN